MTQPPWKYAMSEMLNNQLVTKNKQTKNIKICVTNYFLSRLKTTKSIIQRQIDEHRLYKPQQAAFKVCCCL